MFYWFKFLSILFWDVTWCNQFVSICHCFKWLIKPPSREKVKNAGFQLARNSRLPPTSPDPLTCPQAMYQGPLWHVTNNTQKTEVLIFQGNQNGWVSEFSKETKMVEFQICNQIFSPSFLPRFQPADHGLLLRHFIRPKGSVYWWSICCSYIWSLESKVTNLIGWSNLQKKWVCQPQNKRRRRSQNITPNRLRQVHPCVFLFNLKPNIMKHSTMSIA